MAVMKPDQERVKTLLTDTVTLLCKNGLHYSKELKVQGLLGITLDNDDVFVVHINEIFNGVLGAQITGITPSESSTSAVAAADSATSDLSLKHKKNASKISEVSRMTGNQKKKPIPPSEAISQVGLNVKIETGDDDLVIMDSMDACDFPEDMQGDGDREAMRKSYGRMFSSTEGPPVKRRIPDSISEGFMIDQSDVSCTVEQGADESSSDCAQMSGIGVMPTDIQSTYDDAPGCSGWDPGVKLMADRESKDSELIQQFERSPYPDKGLCSVVMPGLPPSAYHMHYEARPTSQTFNEKNEFGSITSISGEYESGGINMTKPRRTGKSCDRPFACGYPGCDCRFYFRKNMLRHQTYKHGRVKTK